jgi:putative membrane protein insertion efficiency factor
MKQAARSTVLLALRTYKWVLSPWLPPSCRYVPSCSEYAMEAVDRHGVVRGGWMGIWRIIRCHPFVKGGFDPVPLERELLSSPCHANRAVVEGRPSRST